MDLKKWNEIPGSRAVEVWPYTNLHDLNLDWIINTTKEFAAEISRFEDNVTEEVSGFEDRVTVKIGEFEGTIQEYTDRMDAALATVDEKIEYIDNFFSSLDVQQEINNKLNSMAGDGSLAALLKPFADAYMQQDAPGIISAWLAAHITEPEGVVIDSSLSVAGAAADAKAAGGKIETNKRSVASLSQLLAYADKNNLGGDISGLTLNTPYAGFYLTLIHPENLQGAIITAITYKCNQPGYITFHLIDVETMASSVTALDVESSPFASVYAPAAGLHTLVLDSPIIVPFHKILCWKAPEVLMYGASQVSEQHGWILTDTGSNLSTAVNLGISFDYISIDRIGKHLANTIYNGIHTITWAEPAIINMNTRTVSIPPAYVFTEAQSYPQMNGAEIRFASVQYYAWIYLNIDTGAYYVTNAYVFNKHHALVMIIALGTPTAPMIYSALQYKIVHGYIGFIGDSITAGDGGTPYCEEVASIVGADFYNYGHSGCSFTLASGNTFKDYVSTYSENLSTITIWGGVNDLLWFDNYDIFRQEFESFINTMLTKYPRAKFLIITPQKFYLDSANYPGVRTDNWNTPSSIDGKTLFDYVSIEKEIAAKYQIPILDMYNEGIPCVNITQRGIFYNGNGDWLHPNTAGYKYIANRIAAAIKAL